MSIHVLTTDTKVSEPLTKLLQGNQQKLFIYDDLEALIKSLPKLRKTDTVIYDLQMDAELAAFDAIHFAARKTNLVALEPVDESDDEREYHCPENADYYLLLSSDERKARTRLFQLLHEIAQSHVKSQADRKNAKGKSKKQIKAQPVVKTEKTVSDPTTRPSPTLARYLKVKSPAMQSLMAEISEITKKASSIYINGEDGAEFELVAREINFRANGDKSPLTVVDPMHISVDQLKAVDQTEDRITYCYLGLSYELGIFATERLNDFLKELETGAAELPRTCLILGHVADSENYLDSVEVAFLERFKKLSRSVDIPSFADRKEDISLIAQNIFTTMRVAHPFLLTRTLTAGAIEYLESRYEELNYSALVRVIRNAMALTEREVLTEEDLKSFSDDSPTSQHLIESLADEKYFKGQIGAA